MKAEEMMLYDWANDGSANFQITGTQLFDLYMGYMDEPQAIPLTTEILEANGLVKILNDEYSLSRNKYLVRYFKHREKWWCVVEVFPNGGYAMIECNHVHELQHILRLCGLTDFANNLKIK